MYTNTPYSHVRFKGNVPCLMKERQLVMICAHFHEIPKRRKKKKASCHLSASSVTAAVEVT